MSQKTWLTDYTTDTVSSYAFINTKCNRAQELPAWFRHHPPAAFCFLGAPKGHGTWKDETAGPSTNSGLCEALAQAFPHFLKVDGNCSWICHLFNLKDWAYSTDSHSTSPSTLWCQDYPCCTNSVWGVGVAWCSSDRPRTNTKGADLKPDESALPLTETARVSKEAGAELVWFLPRCSITMSRLE